MARHRKIIITFEDESHLKTLLQFRTHPIWIWTICAVVVAALIICGALLTALPPVRTLLNGAAKENQRQLALREIMRVDSINERLQMNQAWMDKFLNAVNPRANDARPDSARKSEPIAYADIASLPDASPVEKRFVSAMEERERFHISVLAPLDADGMMFSSPSPEGVFARGAEDSKVATLMLHSDSPLQAIADGTVVATYLNRSATGYTIIVQHGRGFLSILSHLGTPLVSPGDGVTVGQALALPPGYDAKGLRWVNLRIWHNGIQIVPYEILVSYI